jgi:hypothetical protein
MVRKKFVAEKQKREKGKWLHSSLQGHALMIKRILTGLQFDHFPIEPLWGPSHYHRITGRNSRSKP